MQQTPTIKNPQCSVSQQLIRVAGLAVVIAGWNPSVSAQSSADELAKKLANPVSSLISVPFQLNHDEGGGRNNDGSRDTLNIQPVIPLSIGEDWNMISRTIVPIVSQENYVNDGSWSQSGLGDTVQSLFFSPKEPTAGGMIWGVGPAFLIPTASEDVLGTEKWAAGPTGVFLYQKGKWTYGALGNHLVDFAGEDDRADINATFVQPFASYAPGGGWSYTVNSESTYDWESEQWTVPVNLMVTKVARIGGQMVSVGGGYRNYVDGPDNGPDWGIRLVFTLLFPK